MAWNPVATLSVPALLLFPVDGESQPGRSAAGPIGAFVAREASHMAFEGQQAADPNWSRVRRLKPGTRVNVTVRGANARTLLVVGASESELMVTVARGAAAETFERTEIVEVTRSRAHWLRAIFGAASRSTEVIYRVPDAIAMSDVSP